MTIEERRIGMISNPSVHIAMNQLRLVINELIIRFGHPNSISIELARDLPAGQKRRSGFMKEQTLNQKRNEYYDKKLTEFNLKKSRNNRLLIRFWNEQKEKCIFTGEKIGFSDLFGGDVEIEHLIPYSQSIDNSNANKVVCYR